MKDLPNIVLDAGQNDSLSAITRSAQLTDKELLSAFPFIHPREYGFFGKEESAVQNYNVGNSNALKARLRFLASFIAHHTEAYNKYKHGNSIVVGMEGGLLPEGVDGAIPILIAKNKLELMLAGPIIVDKLLEVLGLTVQLSKTLVERRIQMIELGGRPPVLLCHKFEKEGQTTWSPRGFVTSDEVDMPALDAAFARFMAEAKITKVEMTLRVTIEHSKLQKLIDFYFRDWHLE